MGHIRYCWSFNLLYFPSDVIPDWIVGFGFTDDLGVIAAALAMLGLKVKPEHWEMAEAKVGEWFD